jgi:hypothetical protein
MHAWLLVMLYLGLTTGDVGSVYTNGRDCTADAAQFSQSFPKEFGLSAGCIRVHTLTLGKEK